MTDRERLPIEYLHDTITGAMALRAQWRQTEHIILHQVARLDGRPSTSQEPTSGGDVSNPTVRYGLERARWTHDHDILTTSVIEAAGHIKRANAIVQHVFEMLGRVDTDPDSDLHRCSGGLGMGGHEHWGAPECRRLAVTRDGLCDACRKRRERWQQAERRAS